MRLLMIAALFALPWTRLWGCSCAGPGTPCAAGREFGGGLYRNGG